MGVMHMPAGPGANAADQVCGTACGSERARPRCGKHSLARI